MSYKLIFTCLLACMNVVATEAQKYVRQIDNHYQPTWILKLNLGYDKPYFKNKVEPIRYHSSPIATMSVEKYWGDMGIGIEYHQTTARVSHTYPIQKNLMSHDFIFLKDFKEHTNAIERKFLGVGISYKISEIKKYLLINGAIRAGLSRVVGGSVELRETTTSTQQVLLYHSGYHSMQTFTLLGRANVSYFPKESHWGIGLGFHAIGYYYLSELVDKDKGYSALLNPLDYFPEMNVWMQSKRPIIRKESCDCEAMSYGVNLLLLVRI